MYTLPLFVDKLYSNYNKYMDKILCDAGYKSEENYVYLDLKNLRAFIKPSKYEISKTRKYKEDLKLRESLIYNKKTDSYESKDGDLFARTKDKKRVKKSGYISTSKVYKCFDLNKDGFKTKSLYFKEILEKYRLNSLENITSLECINEKINRSIQDEDAFSKLKEALDYKRFNHKRLKNIVPKINIMDIAMNLNTLTNKIFNKDYCPTRYQISEEKIA